MLTHKKNKKQKNTIPGIKTTLFLRCGVSRLARKPPGLLCPVYPPSIHNRCLKSSKNQAGSPWIKWYAYIHTYIYNTHRQCICIHMCNVCEYKYIPTYNDIVLSHQRKEILPFTTIWNSLVNSLHRQPEHRLTIPRMLPELNGLNEILNPTSKKDQLTGKSDEGQQPLLSAKAEQHVLPDRTRRLAWSSLGVSPLRSPRLTCCWSDLSSCTFSRSSWHSAQWTKGL